MFRNSRSFRLFGATAASLMFATPTPISRLGRRKGGNLDDNEFMGRKNIGDTARYDDEDMLEGEGLKDDFASFVATRQKHMAGGTATARKSGGSSYASLNSLGRNGASHSPSAADGRDFNGGSNDSAVSTSPSALKGKGRRIIVNAGGDKFETFEGTLLQYPTTAFGQMILEQITSEYGSKEAFEESMKASASSLSGKPEIFLDVDPKVFNFVMQFLRSGKIVLPTDDEPLRFAINSALQDFGLLDVAFPPVRSTIDADPQEEDEAIPMVRLPDVCVVQMCDHLQHDQGVKRHALNISYGSDGFALKDLCKKVRKDLNGQLSNTYWQCYQTHERSMFLITTKIANGTADLMMASVTQRLIEHTEQTMGYRLVSSYVTLSPDIKNTNVRLFIHNLIFRRVRNPTIEDTDAVQLFSNPDGSISAAMGVVSGMQHQASQRNREDETFTPNEELFRNFEPPAVGPQGSYDQLGMPLTAPPGQRVPGNIWTE